MKNLLLITLLFFLSFFLSAQTVKTIDQPDKKSILTRNNEGKFSSMTFLGKNAQNEFILNNTPLNRLSDFSYDLKPEHINTDYHLTIHFDKDMTMGGDLVITGSLASFSSYEVMWSPDGHSCEVDVPEDHYEILATYTDMDFSVVLLHNLIVLGNTDTTVSFDAMADHKIFLDNKDENGGILSPTDTNNLQMITTISIEFPDTFNWVNSSYLFQTPDNGYLKISEINPSAGYELLFNEFVVRNGKLYITDLGQVAGISGDTTVANEPSELIKMNMIMNSQPYTFSNYLTFGYGIRHQNSTTLFISTNTDYPSYDKDTLNIYLANRPHLNTAIKSFVGNVFLWDSIPDYNPMGSGDRCIETDPFFINENDSIIFARYQNITPAQYCIEGGTDVNLGNTAPGYYSFLANNLMAPNTIFPYLNISFGEIMEKRTTDNHFSMYEIIKDGTVIVTDTLDNFTAPYIVPDPGPYSFSLSNNNYKIENKQGLAVMNAQFDLSNTDDANPPTLMTFRITGSDGLTRNTFSSTEQGHLLVSGFDFSMTTGKMIKPKEVRSYFKKYSDADWTEIALVEHPEWFDSTTFGDFYTSTLGEVFTQFVTGDYLDLKISLVDSTGNANTYTWHPAAYIENTVGISPVPRNGEVYLRVNPNPVTDNCIVSFNLLQNSAVRLTVYNMKGQLQEVIADKTMIKGTHQMNWNVSEKLTSGIYMLKLEAKDIIKWVKIFVN